MGHQHMLAADREDLEVGWGTSATWNRGKWARWAPSFWFRTQKHKVEWCEKGKKTMQNQEIMVDQSLRHISYPQKLADFNGSMI